MCLEKIKDIFGGQRVESFLASLVFYPRSHQPFYVVLPFPVLPHAKHVAPPALKDCLDYMFCCVFVNQVIVTGLVKSVVKSEMLIT
jgi:hypothetical protein